MNLRGSDFARLRVADDALVAILRAQASDVVVVSSASGRLVGDTGDDVDVIGPQRSLQALDAAVRDSNGVWKILRSFRYGSAGRRTDLVCPPMERALWVGLDSATWLGTRLVRVLDSRALFAMSEIDQVSGLRRLGNRGSVAYAVAKAVVKGHMTRSASARRAYGSWQDCSEDERDWLSSFLRPGLLDGFLRFMSADDGTRSQRIPTARRFAFLVRAAARDPLGVLACAGGSVGLCFARLLKPHGVVVCFTGPDGSGKSTLLRECLPRLSRLFRETRVFHFSPSTLPARTTGEVTDPHGKPAYPAVLGMVKLAYLVIGANLGWVLRVTPRLRIGALVAFDRYFDDILVDPARYRLALPRRLLELACRAVPKADLRVVLVGDEEVVAARKREVSAAQTGTLMASYAALTRLSADSIEVRTEVPPPQAAEAVIAAVLEFMTAREDARDSARGVRT